MRGRVLVLGYHRVASARDDPFGLAVEPELFAAQIDVLCRNASVVSLREAARLCGDSRVPTAAVAVTFDDGYSDVHSHALPILERYGVPFTVFVTTGNPGGEFWWDEMVRLVRSRHLGELSPSPGGTDSGSHTDVTLTIERLQTDLSRLPGDRRSAVLAGYRQGSQTRTPHPATAMEPWQIRAVHATGLAEIGAHTVTHPRLSALPSAERRHEIARCKDDLETMIDAPITSFSYPHGDFDAATVDDVRSAGFRIACTSMAGALHAQTDPLRCPRLWVGNWSPDRFERWLLRWLPARRAA